MLWFHFTALRADGFTKINDIRHAGGGLSIETFNVLFWPEIE
ncbi:Uncharacterised protein [Vibrio cholerae]|nr:Uncharacterised protein [Vibrio cholerae]